MIKFADRIIEEIKESFIRNFCKITYTYYFEYNDDFYGAFFDKKDMEVFNKW